MERVNIQHHCDHVHLLDGVFCLRLYLRRILDTIWSRGKSAPNEKLRECNYIFQMNLIW